MARYIDADRLRAEIEKRIKATMGISHIPCHRREELEGLLSFVDSLQQEQPEQPKIEMAEYYYQEGVCKGFSQGSAEALKILEEFMKRKADPVIVIKQQEHQEVDLEKELDQWRHEHFAGKRDGHYSGEYLERSSQLDIAHHFFNLGLNARKED